MADEILRKNDSEIFEILKNENEDDFSRIFALLKINKITNQEDADIFINLLTNHSNPIREACAIKLDEIFNINKIYFDNDFAKNKIINAISDINPNVCRSICSVFEKNRDFARALADELIKKINLILDDIKIYEKENKDFFNNKIKNKKNHAKNKKLFSLYWLLEALTYSYREENYSEIVKILKYTITFLDYTIREKTAKILINLPNPPYDLLEIVKSDQNFYVKNQVYDKMTLD